jgi:predicted RNA-binding Zn ribbon-like protein
VPRYDIPKAAPQPLREVQLLINSVDLHAGTDWVEDWLAERGLPPDEAGRARSLREALRSLVFANNETKSGGIEVGADALATINEAAARVRLRVDSGGALAVEADGDALDRVVAIALGAMLDGSFGRLKACRNCRWSFYDYSPNRSATWCSMQICGNRRKTRAYRARKARPSAAG